MEENIFTEEEYSKIDMNFAENLTESVAGLLYPSESDEKIKVIDWQADNPAPFDMNLFKKYIGIPPSKFVENVQPAEKFFEAVLTEKEWWTDYEKERAEKFKKVKELMNENLTDLQYLRAGRHEIEAYLLGKDKDGKWKGLKTIIVET